MKVETKKLDEVNARIEGLIDTETIEKQIDKLAKIAQKDVKVDGFRPGKVPLAMVKKIHGERLRQDAEAEALRTLIDEGVKKEGINPSELIGEPHFEKYDKTQEGAIEVAVVIAKRPTPDLEGYKEALPPFEEPEVSDEEIDAKIKEIALSQAPFEPIKRKRALKEGDMAVIDFKGFIDGEAFEGGSAEGVELVIGSGQFIPGFEEQLIGMKIDEEKTIQVTFPQEYGNKELAGKEASFEVSLKEIKTKAEPTIDDALAQKVLNKEDATLDTLKEEVAKQIRQEKTNKLYHEELKPKIVETLVERYTFDVPLNIVEQEIDTQLNAKAQTMEPDEIEALRNDEKKLEALREEIRPDAQKSVRATFIVDILAQKEGVSVSDDEVSGMLYYEAMMSGQDPQEVIRYYQERNLLPAIKMGMIEDKLFTKLLGINR